MQHTYLRYECADAFGLVTSSASTSKAPPSNSILAFVSKKVVLTTAGSLCMGYNLRTNQPTIKVGHRERLSGGVGTPEALNSDQLVSIVVASSSSTTDDHEQASRGDKRVVRIASGWIDGAVRIFEVNVTEINAKGGKGLVQSLLDSTTHNNSSQQADDREFMTREPLVLNGHDGSPVRSLVFDAGGRGTRLASGSSDGTVILWDTLAETGLFRLLGHRGAITDLCFVELPESGMDLLITTSLDGLVKVWDLKEQCCTQTIPSSRGEVWGAACITTTKEEASPAHPSRIRFATGTNDGQVSVWAVETPIRYRISDDKAAAAGSDIGIVSATGAGGDSGGGEEEQPDLRSDDDVCRYMGTLPAPPNVSTSSERILCVHSHPNTKYMGVLHHESRNIDVYVVRSEKDSRHRMQRRLKRKKSKNKTTSKKETQNQKQQKRGLLDDDPEETNSGEEGNQMESSVAATGHHSNMTVDSEKTITTDEFEYFGTVRASHKLKGFAFVPNAESGGGVRIVCALSTNALETHSLQLDQERNVNAEKISTMNMLGHPTGIRAVALSSDDALACTISKNCAKIWNTARRTCVQSLAPSVQEKPCYGLCASFLPGNSHVVVGTREGHLIVLDVSSGDVVSVEENAHDGSIWCLSIRRPTESQPMTAIVTGSADSKVKFWEVETDADDDIPTLVHTRTLETTDDVVAVGYSHSTDSTKRMVFVSSLDSTIKVFFEDSLKFFLSLYGHKLPALALDASDDDAILASCGADKTVKIWGLDFGDTHATLHGHQDSVTDLRFVRRTHNFFTSSKDGTVRFWDGDRFQHILTLNGHFSEVCSLAVSRSGAFVLSVGMDRQVRVWERTKDIVFLEEERERELEATFDRLDNRDSKSALGILETKGDDPDNPTDQVQSDAAMKKSLLSVAAGDRIMEALERADYEKKEIAAASKRVGAATRSPNPLLLGMEPPVYVLWVLKSVQSAELESSLVLLPLGHVERLFYYLVEILKAGRAVELCARVAVFLVKIHQNQILTSKSMSPPLRELRRLLRMRLLESRDMIGCNLAALRIASQTVASRQSLILDSPGQDQQQVWAGIGLGSDLAAAIEGRGGRQ